MDIFEVIRSRRSIKAYKDRPVSKDEIERLLSLAVLAPNHRMTEPWRFYVLGPEARAAYGAALGARKAKRVEDPDAAAAVIAKVEQSHRDLPSMLAVSTTLDGNPEIREEDYAAAYMAVQNLCLAAAAMGLGTHVKTGGVMDDPRARAAVGVGEDERIVATVSLGEPAEVPEPKPRRGAAEFTTWVP
ncbi:MAG: nitroreductase [Gemmatimonadota bacterium]|nr:nitroreductase [Gemmatimonadota bacterium]MDH3425015.1 nitroreductase [Gemmatimonadota bacterium]